MTVTKFPTNSPPSKVASKLVWVDSNPDTPPLAVQVALWNRRSDTFTLALGHGDVLEFAQNSPEVRAHVCAKFSLDKDDAVNLVKQVLSLLTPEELQAAFPTERIA